LNFSAVRAHFFGNVFISIGQSRPVIGQIVAFWVGVLVHSSGKSLLFSR
jgi:hypothetical protein